MTRAERCGELGHPGDTFNQEIADAITEHVEKGKG